MTDVDAVCPCLGTVFGLAQFWGKREDTKQLGVTPKAPSPARSNASSRTSLSRDSRRNRSAGGCQDDDFAGRFTQATGALRPRHDSFFLISEGVDVGRTSQKDLN